MIFLKTVEEIEQIKEGAMILSKAHGLIAQKIRPGLATKVLDELVEVFIKDHHGKPSFKGYKGFPFTLCTSIGEHVVHGLPSDYELKEGDVVSVDCGVYYKGFHSDAAFTYPVGEQCQEVMDLLKTTKQALYLGIDEVSTGKRIGDIGHTIQSYVEKYNYSVVRELGGHGIGRRLHEAPDIPNYGKRGRGRKIEEGMVLAIEPMINLGTKYVVQEENNGSFRTLDRKPSVHFEHTVAVVKGRAEILTTYKYIEEVFKF
ncbi:MAG: type I methionyl aminopeptidase [Cytophagales bacterium]|nr:type I methionyl aminopeptidase [Cytophagales bacterium]